MLWGRRAWLQIKSARCMAWCFLLATLWSNVAFSVSTNSLLLTRMLHAKEVQHGWWEYPVNHDWRAVPALREHVCIVWMDATHHQIGTTNHKVLFFFAGDDRWWPPGRRTTLDALRHIQTLSPIQPPSDCHPWINDVIQEYTDVFDEDLFNLGHCNLITLTIKLYGCWPIILRVYCTSLWIREVVTDKSGCNLVFNITMGGASHIDRQKDESYLDLLHQLL